MNKTLNRVGALLGALFLLSVFDTVISGYTEPDELCRIFPGSTEFVSGKISADSIPSLKDLMIVADSPLITVDFVEARGRMWRGKIHVPESMPVGTYHFKTLLRWQKPAEEATAYTVHVFKDESAYEKSFYSLFHRVLGVAPSWITAFTFPALLVCLFLSFRISSQREARLNAEGRASIFKVTRRKGGCEVSFGLGEADGIRIGESLWLWNDASSPIGEVTVQKVTTQYTTAEVDSSLQVKPGYLVGKKQ